MMPCKIIESAANSRAIRAADAPHCATKKLPQSDWVISGVSRLSKSSRLGGIDADTDPRGPGLGRG